LTVPEVRHLLTRLALVVPHAADLILTGRIIDAAESLTAGAPVRHRKMAV